MMTLPSLAAFATAIFVLAITMNVIRKNRTLLFLYVVQSFVSAGALITLAYADGALGLMWAGVLTLLVKTIMAPVFLTRMISRYGANFSSASYVSTPLALLTLAATTGFAYGFVARGALAEGPGVPLLFAAVFASLFFLVNRRGALGQVIGILSLENAIVLVAAYIGLEHSIALELAIAFDIAVWILIAVGFLAMIYRQFGSDVGALAMTHLKED